MSFHIREIKSVPNMEENSLDIGGRRHAMDSYNVTCMHFKVNRHKLETLCVIDRTKQNTGGDICTCTDEKRIGDNRHPPIRRAPVETRQQIALCEMGEVAKQEPRLKHYLTVNRNACKCRPDCWSEYQIKPEQIPPIEVPQSFLNPKYNPPKEEPIRKPKILSGWPTVDDKGQHPVPVETLNMHREYDSNHLDMSQFNWKPPSDTTKQQPAINHSIVWNK